MRVSDRDLRGSLGPFARQEAARFFERQREIARHIAARPAAKAAAEAKRARKAARRAKLKVTANDE